MSRRLTLDGAMLTGLVGFAVLELAFGVTDLAHSRWLDGFGSCMFGLAFLLFPIQRRAWLRVGYYRGRASVLDSLREAGGRGMSFTEWATAEIERDLG